MKRGSFYGYDFRGTQPCVPASLNLPWEPEGDLDRVDAWMAHRLRVDPDRLAAVQPLTAQSADAFARATAERVLVLYGELAEAANLPCFDPGRVLAVEQEADGGFVARLALTVVDNVPKEVFARLFDEALRTVQACRTLEPTEEAVRGIFAGVNRALAEIKPLIPFYGVSTIPLCRIAHRAGIPFRHVGSGFLRLGVGRAGQLIHKSSLQSDSAVGATACVDKRYTARILLAAGLPGAEHIQVGSSDAALAAAREIGWPVVVKPADRERSIGVTASIANEAGLLAGYDKARAVSANILVERHVAGVCHRIFVVGDKVFYAVRRIPKRVVGNGRDSIATLVEDLNTRVDLLPPWKPFPPYPLDALALECLATDGFTPESVPDDGQSAFLRPIATPEWGGQIDDLTKAMHPDNAALAIAATHLFDLTVAGVDLMTTDITQPWHATGAIINEMNFRPQLAIGGREVDATILGDVLVSGDGCIPVHAITGHGDLEQAARDLKARLARAGRNCHTTSATATHAPDGREIFMVPETMFERGIALSMRRDVEELILIGAPGEFTSVGLPVPRLESLTVVDANAARAERLVAILLTRFHVREHRVTSGLSGERVGQPAAAS